MKKLIIYLLALPILIMSCQETGIDTSSGTEMNASKSSELKLMDININKITLYKKNKNKEGDFANQMTIVNEALIEYGIQIEKMEFLGAEGAGNTVYFKNIGNKQLESEFVPNDPRNWWPANPYLGEWTDGSLGYWMDGTEQGTNSGLSDNQTIDAFQSAMTTWGSVSCSDGLVLSNQGVTSLEDYGDVGYVQWLVTGGFQGSGGVATGSIVHAGNLPPWFFDAIGGPGGGAGILGVTFTFTWIQDINQNGKGDVAIKEIYMNDGFNWQDAPDDFLGSGEFDYETVILHEAGHGLSQGHFGKAFRNNGNGKLQFAPYALMNAGYSQAQREITASDNGGHCSNWGQWPNN